MASRGRAGKGDTVSLGDGGNRINYSDMYIWWSRARPPFMVRDRWGPSAALEISPRGPRFSSSKDTGLGPAQEWFACLVGRWRIRHQR
jgi:hypothetical protein